MLIGKNWVQINNTTTTRRRRLCFGQNRFCSETGPERNSGGGTKKKRGEKQKKVWRAGTRTRESGDCLTSKAEDRFFGGRRKLLS